MPGVGFQGGCFPPSSKNFPKRNSTTPKSVFLLRFTRVAYKTTSTNVLNVLTGIPPLHITAKAEFCKFQIWVRHSPIFNHIVNNIPLDSNVNIKNTPSEQKTIILPSTIQDAEFEVYTDGSRIDNETELAVCIFQQDNNISNFLFKLNSCNSVFQAELEAIHFACNWALQNNSKINIHTDSLSSILAIQSANSRSGFVYTVKQDIFKAKHLVGLSWVKAHVGIPGNEWADQQAKSAIISGVENFIPAPLSFLRRTLKQQILSEWNDYFMNYNSASGARARDFIDKADFNFLITNKFLIFFLCGHGPFPFYLNRFKLLACASAERWATRTIMFFRVRSPKTFISADLQMHITKPGSAIFYTTGRLSPKSVRLLGSISEKTKIKKSRDHKKSTKKSNQLAQAKESKEEKRAHILAAKRDQSSLGDGPLSREDFLKDSFKQNNIDDDSDTLKVHPSEESDMSTSEVDDLPLSS
ncbi:hypothetical protein AVEN_43841-1 [Araneus ventricosus]|uniref:RNase H type-1 domain-containing protein n=1 Tax=Araneus ventricosus TaxID=182803 RepID=A0A4Y2TCE4_ARAVE|nr:hypothetical protein AVEN_43841-1 [Araneus ventricosus]